MISGRSLTPLYLAFGGALVIASFGLWGAAFEPSPPATPYLYDEAWWLSDPVPPTPPIPPEACRSATPLLAREWGPSPFLNAGERRRWGGAFAYLDGMTPSDAVTLEMPELKALIDAGTGDPVVILDDAMLRVGERVGRFRVDRIEGRRVLVTSTDGSRWLEVAERDGIDIKESNR